MGLSKRLASLDVFRGLTIMLMIIVDTPGSYDVNYSLMMHSPWIGCTLADLVFPFFLFSVGLSGFLSTRKQGNILTKPLIKKILRRTILLFLLGILFNTFPYYQVDEGLSLPSVVQAWANLRLFGVLQRIAIAYFLGIILSLLLKSPRRILLAAAALLLLHTAGLFLYAPDAPFGEEHNLEVAIGLIFPGPDHIYQGFGFPFDPEGIYGSISATANVMFGYLFGILLFSEKLTLQRLRKLAGCSLLFIAAGLLLGTWIPVCKSLWTSSYVLLTSGIGLLLLLGFLYLEKTLSCAPTLFHPFQAFGTNAIFFFLFSGFVEQSLGMPWILIDEAPVHEWIFTNLFIPFFPPEAASLLFSLLFLFFDWLVAEYLYHRQIFWKI